MLSELISLISSSLPVNNVAVLQKVWDHHAKVSGYAPVSHGLGLIVDTERDILPHRVINRLRIGSTSTPRKVKEIVALMNCFRRTKLFVVDGDFSIPLLSVLRQFDEFQIVAVFHQPPDMLEGCLKGCESNLVDHAICVSMNQMEMLADLVGVSNVSFIPHGVTCSWFTPSKSTPKEFQFLTVGVHRRDFVLLQKIARKLKSVLPNVKVKVVLPKRYLPSCLTSDCIDFEFDVTDERLLQLYRESYALIMPLEAATANNAILEAMSCGLPVIASNIGGIPDYVTPECGFLCSNDEDSFISAAKKLVADPSLRYQCGRFAREKACEFDWSTIRSQLQQLLKNL
jgi:glycosyltransferase involved in cell wall biosynthesis